MQHLIFKLLAVDEHLSKSGLAVNDAVRSQLLDVINQLSLKDKEADAPKAFQSESILDDIVEQYSDEKLLSADGFDDAVIGIDERSMRLIYSVSKCIAILMPQMEVEEDELEDGESVQDKQYKLAVEYLEYNTFGAYMGEKTPIWCFDDFNGKSFEIFTQAAQKTDETES